MDEPGGIMLREKRQAEEYNSSYMESKNFGFVEVENGMLFIKGWGC